MPQFEKRQAIQMAKDLVALGLSGLRSHTSAPIYAPEDVSRTSQDVVNSLCQCLECNGTLDADCLQDAIEWLTELHSDVDGKLRKEHEIACENVERWIALLQQGIMQNHQDSDGSLDGGLVDLTLMTSAHLGLRELMQEMDEASSEKISLQQSHMLQTGNTVVKNMGTVTHAVERFHILPKLLSEIIRDLSSEEELSAGTSKAVARMLCVSRSCNITAVLAHAALTTQVASASITEIYLCEFHLVWQTVLTRFHRIFSKAYRLSDDNPEVLVDAVRCARLLDAVLRELIDDIIIRNLRSDDHSSDEKQNIAVELLLIGLDEVAQATGLAAEIVSICRCLIARFAATCGEHIVVVLGQGFQPRLKAADVTPNRGTKMRNFAFPGPEVLESSSGASLEDIPEQDLFQVHWPPALGAREGLAPESTVDKIELTDQGSKGVHACDDGGRKLKSPELRDIPDSLRSSVRSHASSHSGSALSFASDVKSPHIVEYDGAEWPDTSDVFWKLMQHWVIQGLKHEVYDLTDVSAAACEDVDDGEVKGPPISVEDRVETAVRKCMEFLKTVDNQLSPCFPSRTGWDILHTAFSAVNIRVREIIFWAAQDDLKQWTFKDYVNLVKLIFELMASAGELGVSSDTLQDLEADLQEARERTSFSMQIIYTRAGNLAQQFLMLCIDGATLKGDFLAVESEGSCATLPECIELLRMMHEQVELARGVNCWPLLQLVSIGCHASCSTLHERMHKMCEPQVQSPQIGTSCTLAHSGKIPPFSPLAIASTPTKEHKPIPFQGTPSPGVPARSPGIGANKKMHTYGIMTYFIAASKPEIQLQQCWGKAKTHEHEYPVQFMAALANTMQRIAEECQNTGLRIRGNTTERRRVPGTNEERSWQAPAALTQDQRDACEAACSQAEEWNQLEKDFLHTSQLCVNSMLQLVFDDVAWVLQRMFTSHWLTEKNSSVQDGGLSTVLATCADYIGEVRGLAEQSILLAFLRSLLRHLVCCIAARMLLSELPFDSVWQRATTEELRRLHSFVDTDMPELAGSAADYLNMLAQYRACLCAPDEFTATSSYKQLIRFGELGVEWVDAAWKQDARTTTERKSDFYQSALRTCEEIAKESTLSEVQVTQVKKYAFKWKAPSLKNTAGSPNTAGSSESAGSPKIRAHRGATDVQQAQGSAGTTQMGRGEIERLNPYVLHLAESGTMVYEIIQKF